MPIKHFIVISINNISIIIIMNDNLYSTVYTSIH